MGRENLLIVCTLLTLQPESLESNDFFWKKCFLQISDRCMIFKSKVYWMKWFSSSCSAKGVSFKFQLDSWYSNPKSTESNDFHRLTVQKVFPSNFRLTHDIQIQSLLNEMIFIVMQCKRCFLQISDRCIIFKSKVYWLKWFSSSYSSKGVSFKFQIDAWYSKPKSTASNDFHRLTVQKVFPSNFR